MLSMCCLMSPHSFACSDGAHMLKRSRTDSAAIMDELAAHFGFSYSTVSADIDEKMIRHENPEELVMMLAHAKVMAILERWQDEDAVPSEGWHPDANSEAADPAAQQCRRRTARVPA